MPERYSEGRVLESESTLLVFFFSSRRRHTRCSRDWSSDVCSSDLVNLGVALAGVLAYLILSINVYLESQAFGVFRLGRSEERRVGKSVDLGGRRIIKKKKKKTRMVRCGNKDRDSGHRCRAHRRQNV